MIDKPRVYVEEVLEKLKEISRTVFHGSGVILEVRESEVEDLMEYIEVVYEAKDRGAEAIK